MGAADCRPVQIGSPFDYEKQMTLHLVKKMPEPNDPAYQAALERWISHFADQSNARAFVLFTSYQTMRAAAQALETHFAAKGWNLLVQGMRCRPIGWSKSFARIPGVFSSAWIVFGAGWMSPARRSQALSSHGCHL